MQGSAAMLGGSVQRMLCDQGICSVYPHLKFQPLGSLLVLTMLLFNCPLPSLQEPGGDRVPDRGCAPSGHWQVGRDQEAAAAGCGWHAGQPLGRGSEGQVAQPGEERRRMHWCLL